MEIRNWFVAALLAVLLVCPVALAGKGGSKGKPGGGDNGGGGDPGGSSAQGVVYLGCTTGKRNRSTAYVLVGTVAGDSPTSAAQASGCGIYRQLAVSPDGAGIALRDAFAGLSIHNRSTGSEYTILENLFIEGTSKEEGSITWTGRRNTDGTYEPLENQFVVVNLSSVEAQSPCDVTYSLYGRNIHIVPTTSMGAPHTAIPITDYTWTVNGTSYSEVERAHRGVWLGERTDVQDRAWVIFLHEYTTYVPQPGSDTCNAPTATTTWTPRIVTLDTSSWPQIGTTSRTADVELIDDDGFAFDVLEQFDVAVSRDGSHIAWVESDIDVGDGLLHVAPLLVTYVGSGTDAEPTLVVDRSNEDTYSPPSGYAWKGGNLALSDSGRYVAVATMSSSQDPEDIQALDRDLNTWTVVSTSNHNVTAYGYSVDFDAPPATD